VLDEALRQRMQQAQDRRLDVFNLKVYGTSIPAPTRDQRAMARRQAYFISLLFAALVAASDACSQAWPDRPVKIIVPYAAGGTSDGVGRLLAARLGDVFGQPFIIENRPGASGAIAAEAVMRAPPDGYTLFLASLPQITIMPLVLKTSFDPRADVVPISLISTNPMVIVANPQLPAKSIADFVAYAREHRGRLTYAAVGTGSFTHLAMALFLKRAGIEMTPVMYKGGAPAITDVVAGRVSAHFALVSNILPYVQGGLLRPLAVSSAHRLPQMPSVPTMIEAGYPGFVLLNWTGLVAPAGTPRMILDRIALEVSRAARDPKIAAQWTGLGVDPVGSGPEGLKARIDADIPLWKDAVGIAGLRPQ